MIIYCDVHTVALPTANGGSGGIGEGLGSDGLGGGGLGDGDDVA